MLAVAAAVVVATVARRVVSETLWVGPASAKTALTRVIMFLRGGPWQREGWRGRIRAIGERCWMG